MGNYNNRKRALSSVEIKSTKSDYVGSSNSELALTMQKVDARSRCNVSRKNHIQNNTNNIFVERSLYLCYVNGQNCIAEYHDCW